MTLTLFSPVKINLFLSITGRRDDGYHELETLFQLLNVGDKLTLTRSEIKKSKLPHSLPVFSLSFTDNTKKNPFTKPLIEQPSDDNLIIKAAQLLYAYAVEQNIADLVSDTDILLDKKMPLGAGLGAGSSNAASTLIGLNQLWQLNIDTHTLSKLALNLGADVPIFIMNHSAFATGVGECIQPVELSESFYLLVYPNTHVVTKELFQSQMLDRNAPIRDFNTWLNTPFYNVFEPIARKLYPEIECAFKWLEQYGTPQMTGTGSTVFIKIESEQRAQEILTQVPNTWWACIAKGTNSNTLF